jgi:sucrose-6-phosphate hydrolase SacC (GH32 family)
MNDPNGTIYHDGWYHVFYQHNPFGDGWGFMHWGHARSRDLATWEQLPIALAPDIAAGEAHCFSGCIAPDADGSLRLLYTSVAFPDRRPHLQLSATPCDADLQTWKRHPGIAMHGHGPDGRDPFVLRWGGRTLALLGDGPRVLLYEAEGGCLDRLDLRGTLHEEHSGMTTFCECPNLLPVDGRALLLVSPTRRRELASCAAVEWMLGDLVDDRLRIERRGRLDLHDDFYATNTLIDASGRHVVFGWVRGFRSGKGWSGCLAFPRLVESDPDAGIRQRPHPAVELLRRGEALRFAGRLGEADLGDGDDAVDCELSADGPFQIQLAGNTIAWDGAYLAVGGTTCAVAPQVMRLRVLVDRTVVEIFADEGRLVVTRVVYVEQRDCRVRVSGSCQAKVVVHPLASCTAGA